VPPLLQMAGHGGTVSKRTANKKLTKLYWPSRKRSPKRLIVLSEPKSGGARPKKIFLADTFKFVPAPLTLYAATTHFSYKTATATTLARMSHVVTAYCVQTDLEGCGALR